MRGSVLVLVALGAPVKAQVVNSTNTTQTGISLDAGLSVALLPPVFFNTRGISFPDFRYTPWDELDMSMKLGAEIAGCKYGVLDSAQKKQSLTSCAPFTIDQQTRQKPGTFQGPRK